MKALRFFMVFLTAGFIFSSCQKELSEESGTARGSLKADGTGDCMPVLVNGTYAKDTLLKSSNYAEIQINITQTGSYFIKTDTVNGYSFSASGSAAVAGLNTVRLLGSGKPIAAGVNIFQVRFDSTVCEINVNVTGTGGGGTAAIYTLGGSPGTCTGAALSGTYMQGMATGASNTATVNVSVTQPGTYTISSGAPVNGVTFSGSGTFSGVGANTIVLTASGIPTSAGPFTYPISSGTSNCSFSVTYSAATPPAAYTINCSGATTAGTYQAGVPTSSANTVTISATSTNAGSYSITTPVMNGVSFSGSGTFPGATTQPVVLTATGTPTAAGTFSFTATAATGGSTCAFPVTFTAAATDFITANVNGVFTTFNVGANGLLDNTSLPGYSVLDIIGSNNATTSEAIEFAIGKATASGAIAAGTYTVNQGPNVVVFGDYTDSAATDYQAQTDGTVQANPFTITITSITATRATGTFFGPLKDNSGAGPGVKTITSGSFSVPVM